MFDQALAQYTQDLTLLYVEDDPVSQLIIKNLLGEQFKRVLQAEDGHEGLRLYAKEQPDLILTDLAMPRLDGIGMLREIRKTDHKTPVVLMTASLDHMELTEAINLGVSKFVAKPLELNLLRRSLLSVTREIAVERLARQAQAQEMELLRYRDRYHSRQQELAQRKEQHINHNQLKGLLLPTEPSGGFVAELLHQPKDIMSGDSYALRLRNGQPFLLVADAMGSGLSASVTSMLATSFFNYLLDDCSCHSFGLEQVVQKTTAYIRHNLLDDEVFSCLFATLHPDEGSLELAAFGFPPLLLLRNGELAVLRGDNPPLSAFSPPPRLRRLQLDGVTDLLICTDGLTDALAGDQPYRHRLGADLAATCGVADLWERFTEACPSDDDDCTLIRLTRCGLANQRTLFERSCPGDLRSIAALQREVVAFWTAAGIAKTEREHLELAIGELLMNALEHGCLGLGSAKQEYLLNGRYEELITAATESSGTITLRCSVEERGDRLLVWCDLEDPGQGYPVGAATAANHLAPCGRGLKMATQSVDLLARSVRGNRVAVRKSVIKERV